MPRRIPADAAIHTRKIHLKRETNHEKTNRVANVNIYSRPFVRL